MTYHSVPGDGELRLASITQGVARDPASTLDLTPDEARRELIRVLELDDDASWSDVVTYTAKARSTTTVCLNTVPRRTKAAAEALGHPRAGEVGWAEVLDLARALRPFPDPGPNLDSPDPDVRAANLQKWRSEYTWQDFLR